MSAHPAARLVAALAKMREQMQFLVDHPRMQQNRWVARGREWLPILEQAQTDLEAETSHYHYLAEAHQALLDALARGGLILHQRDRTTWAYSWHGAPPIGAYPSQAQAVEAALRARSEKGR